MNTYVDLESVIAGPARIVILLGLHLEVEAEVFRHALDHDRLVFLRFGEGIHPSLHHQNCEFFKKAGRVVITTFSPLVVGYFEDPDVVILRLDEDEKKWEKLLPPIGMTAEDILTGAYFGLASTLGPETLRLLNEHHALMRRVNHLTELEQAARRRLEEQLRQRLRRYNETSVEGMVLSVVAELEADPRFNRLSSQGIRDLRAEVIHRIKHPLGHTDEMEILRLEREDYRQKAFAAQQEAQAARISAGTANTQVAHLIGAENRKFFVVTYYDRVTLFDESQGEHNQMLASLRQEWKPYNPCTFPGSLFESCRQELLRLEAEAKVYRIKREPCPDALIEREERIQEILRQALPLLEGTP